MFRAIILLMCALLSSCKIQKQESKYNGQAISDIVKSIPREFSLPEQMNDSCYLPYMFKK